MSLSDMTCADCKVSSFKGERHRLDCPSAWTNVSASQVCYLQQDYNANLATQSAMNQQFANSAQAQQGLNHQQYAREQWESQMDAHEKWMAGRPKKPSSDDMASIVRHTPPEPHPASLIRETPYVIDKAGHEKLVAEAMTLRSENAELLQENAKLRRQLERIKK